MAADRRFADITLSPVSVYEHPAQLIPPPSFRILLKPGQFAVDNAEWLAALVTRHELTAKEAEKQLLAEDFHLIPHDGADASKNTIASLNDRLDFNARHAGASRQRVADVHTDHDATEDMPVSVFIDRGTPFSDVWTVLNSLNPRHSVFVGLQDKGARTAITLDFPDFISIASKFEPQLRCRVPVFELDANGTRLLRREFSPWVDTGSMWEALVRESSVADESEATREIDRWLRPGCDTSVLLLSDDVTWDRAARLAQVLWKNGFRHLKISPLKGKRLAEGQPEFPNPPDDFSIQVTRNACPYDNCPLCISSVPFELGDRHRNRQWQT